MSPSSLLSNDGHSRNFELFDFDPSGPNILHTHWIYHSSKKDIFCSRTSMPYMKYHFPPKVSFQNLNILATRCCSVSANAYSVLANVAMIWLSAAYPVTCGKCPLIIEWKMDKRATANFLTHTSLDILWVFGVILWVSSLIYVFGILRPHFTSVGWFVSHFVCWKKGWPYFISVGWYRIRPKYPHNGSCFTLCVGKEVWFVNCRPSLSMMIDGHLIVGWGFLFKKQPNKQKSNIEKNLCTKDEIIYI